MTEMTRAESQVNKLFQPYSAFLQRIGQRAPIIPTPAPVAVIPSRPQMPHHNCSRIAIVAPRRHPRHVLSVEAPH